MPQYGNYQTEEEALLAWEPDGELVGHPENGTSSAPNERNYKREDVRDGYVLCAKGSEICRVYQPEWILLGER